MPKRSLLALSLALATCGMLVGADSGEIVGTGGAAAATQELSWSPDGSRLLQATERSLLIREVRAGKLAAKIDVGPARALALPAGAAVQGAAFSPHGETIAALLRLRANGTRPARSEVLLIDPAGSSPARSSPPRGGSPTSPGRRTVGSC